MILPVKGSSELRQNVKQDILEKKILQNHKKPSGKSHLLAFRISGSVASSNEDPTAMKFNKT